MTNNPTQPDVEKMTSPESVPGEPAGHPKAPDLKPPSGPRRMFSALFSRESRLGRFTRAALRVLALVVIFFALGALAVYFWLYRPAAQQLTEVHSQATQAAGQMSQTRQDLTSAQQDLQTARTQSAQMQTRLDTELTRSQILRASNAILQTRMAIQANNKAGAVHNLDVAQGYLQAIKPVLDKYDAQQSSTLQALFTLAKNDLDRDLKLAGQDLDRLQSELDRAESNLPK